MGHESITTTARIYAHLYDDELDSVAAALDRIGPGALRGMTASTHGQNAATSGLAGMKKARVVWAVVALTWAFVWSRLSESNRRPIHYE